MSDAVTLQTIVGPCHLRRARRRTLAISVLPDGHVEMIGPVEASTGAIIAKVSERAKWIRRQQRAFREMNAAHRQRRYCSGASHRYLGKQYRLKVRVGQPSCVKLVGAYFHLTTSHREKCEVNTLLSRWLRAKAKEQFARRIESWHDWCRAHHLPIPRLCLRTMRKRWGSAHRDGRIFLNPELVRAPSLCIDYVIAHEICHLRHPRHDKAFIRLLDRVFSNWRSAKHRLEHTDL